MKKYKYFIGIDVSKSTLDAYVLSKTDDIDHFRSDNSNAGVQELFARISEVIGSLKAAFFCIENTGFYAMQLLYSLEHDKLDYSLVASLEISRSKGIRRQKTDKEDAKMIALYARSNLTKLRLSTIPENAILKLQVLHTERDKVIRFNKGFEMTEEYLSLLPIDITKVLKAINSDLTAELKKAQEKIEKEMMKTIENHPKIKMQYDLITSIPGIGMVTAIYLIISTRCFQAFANWRKLACWSGVAPFEPSSGTSLKGKAHVHPFGNRKMKALLSTCALSAKRYDNELKAYYEKKIAAGKAPMQVLNAIRCKLLARVFAVIRKQTPYISYHEDF